MDFRLLGPFEVHDGDTQLQIGSLRQRAVLALLTIHVGQTLSADRIIDEVWAGSPPPSALKTLHAYISRLRRVLGTLTAPDGGELLVSRSPGYLLRLEKVNIDAGRFERIVADASASLGSGRPEMAADQLHEAESLWRGHALADFVYEPFAVHEALRLTERRIEALEMRIEADLMLARHASLVSELEALVAEHPMREKLWAQLMTALYRCGRQADALSAYGRIRRHLIDELGIEPGPDLRRLERQVLEQAPELGWEPVPSLTTETPMTIRLTEPDTGEARPMVSSDTDHGLDLLPLVGREAQLERLGRALSTIPPEGSPQLVLLTGEAGCGKTRLLSELQLRARTQGVLVASGSAEREGASPYGTLAELVRGVVTQTGPGTLDRVGHLRDDLAWLLPELGPHPSTPSGDLGLARTRLFEAVLYLLSTAGSGEPLLLLVDDAHGMGEGILSLVNAVLDRQWTRPMMVILGIRTGPTERRSDAGDPLVDLLRRDRTVVLEVGRLTQADLFTLVEETDSAPSTADLEEVVLRLHEQTAGIPLLVRELLATGLESMEATTRTGSAIRSANPLVDGVIGHRLSRLSAETQRMLEVAAVVGLEFDVEVLAAVTEDPPLRVTRLLEEAVDAGMVVETATLDVFAFDHGLIRDVAAAAISASRQVRLHGEVAGALAARGSSVEAARHGLAGFAGISAEEATSLVLQGADGAFSALDFETARRLCEEALAGPAVDLGPRFRSDLFLRVGQALSLTGHPSEAEQAFMTAAELAGKVDDVDRLARIAVGTASLGHVHTGASEFRWTLLCEVLERMGPGWTPLRLHVASEWLIEAVLPHRRALTPQFVEEVVDAAKELGDPKALAAAYHARHVLARARLLPQSSQWSREFADLTQEVGSSEWLFEGYLSLLIEAAAEANGPAMDNALDQLRQTCATYRAPRALWRFELAAGSCARVRGEFEIADEHMAAAGLLGERHGIGDSLPALAAGSVLNGYHRGGLEALRGPLADFAGLAPEVPAWTFAAGLAAVADGDVSAGRSALDSGMEVLPDQPEEIWLAGVCLASELVGLVGADPEIPGRLFQLLAPHSGRFAIIGTMSSEFGPTDRCLGILSAILGDVDGADGYFSSAIRVCDQLRARPWELRTAVDRIVVDRWSGRSPSPGPDELEAELVASGLGGTLDRLNAPFCGD